MSSAFATTFATALTKERALRVLSVLAILAGLSLALVAMPSAPAHAAGASGAPTPASRYASLGLVKHTTGDIATTTRSGGGAKGGLTSNATWINSSCPSKGATYQSWWPALTQVYYVNAWPAVNVRQTAGWSCVVTSQNYTTDVVRVPGSKEVWSGGVPWIEVAFYLGKSSKANNYSWAEVGWVDAYLLTSAKHGVKCVAGECNEFNNMLNGAWGAWGVDSILPSNYSLYDYAQEFGPIWPWWACNGYYDRANTDACQNVAGGTYMGWGSLGSSQIYALSGDPSWFYVSTGMAPDIHQYFLWNYVYFAY